MAFVTVANRHDRQITEALKVEDPVRVHHTDALALPVAAAVFVVLAAMAGCNSPAVGSPCLPEQVPEGGFDVSEAYIESSSVQCETRVCMVWHLSGVPTTAQGCNSGDCASEDELSKYVYCTCRCESGNSKFASCTCPSGFTCTPVLEQGSEGVRGSYCVRTSTVTLVDM
jgi:hypothetical protein